MTIGSLPPSSRCSFFIIGPAREAIRFPMSSEPVKAITGTSGCSTNGSPTSGPYPVTTFTTPGGKWPQATSTIFNVDREVNSEGLITTVFPAARAGAIFQARSNNGKFQGTIQATTPYGSLRTKLNWSGSPGGMTRPVSWRASSA